MSDIIFRCPHCKKESINPRKEGWKIIDLKDWTWGIKFCPKCYEVYKDKGLTFNDFKDGLLRRVM